MDAKWAEPLYAPAPGEVSMLLAAWYHLIFATVFSMLSLLLMLVILLQRGKGVGLSGAFGAAGGHTALGSKTGDVLTWITMVGAGVFLFLTIILNYFFQPLATTPAATPEPAAPTPADAVPPAGGQGPTPGIDLTAADRGGDYFRPALWSDICPPSA